ncbi:MAG: hypothetical protein C0424_12065 [Sphingobacteriaceae bacterium]|nr:hypothetical protein [Sphingobacteriaceae bacterium]
MDTAAQIKEDLIAKIKESEDLDFLKALQNLFDASYHEPFSLTAEQQAAIELGKSQIESGLFTTHAQLMANARQWLTQK